MDVFSREGLSKLEAASRLSQREGHVVSAGSGYSQISKRTEDVKSSRGPALRRSSAHSPVRAILAVV